MTRRVPAGSSDGGQFASGDSQRSEAGQVIVDGDVATLHQWQPGDSYDEFVQQVGSGNFVEVEMDGRNGPRTIRGWASHDPAGASTLTLRTGGYDIGLDTWGEPSRSIRSMKMSVQQR